MSESGAASAGADGRWDLLAREAAQHREAGGEPLDLRRLLAFELDGAPYALPIERVREIVRIRPITPVPRVPEDVLGVISLRGEIVQVIDLRRRLGLVLLDPTRSSRVIVVQGADGQAAGLLVDAVTETLSVGEDALRQAAGEGGSVEALCVRDEKFISLVDLDRVLAIDADH